MYLSALDSNYLMHKKFFLISDVIRQSKNNSLGILKVRNHQNQNKGKTGKLAITNTITVFFLRSLLNIKIGCNEKGGCRFPGWILTHNLAQLKVEIVIFDEWNYIAAVMFTRMEVKPSAICIQIHI